LGRKKKASQLVGVVGGRRQEKTGALTWRIEMTSQMVPRFLQPSPLRTQSPVPVPVQTAYSHQRPFGQAQVLWWPCACPVVPRTVLLFIPGPCIFLSPFPLSSSHAIFSGNPGLLDFYVPFLDAIYHEVNSSTSSPVTIFAHAHLGLSSYIGGNRSFLDTSSVSLPAQIQAHLEFLDELLASYGPETNVLLVGHSIGAWFIQEMLKARSAAALRRVGAFMLFPTISEIGRSTSGKILSVRQICSSWHIVCLMLSPTQPIFRPPWPRVLAYLSLLAQYTPQWILRFVMRSWPESQLQVLRRFLQAPAAIYAALTLADEEMRTVLELDAGFLRDFSDEIWFFYAESDDWVGGQREVVLRALRGTPAESRVVHGRSEIPHGFCISEESSFEFRQVGVF
jgi:pimeloyl-ACP methyl ester carboxylesterase